TLGVGAEYIANLNLQCYRKRFSFFQQKAFVLSVTIAQILRHVKKNATVPEMNHATEIAQASQIIQK
ncbi:ABC transporter ATP-binding protein, partial [Enterococcus gallinarum]